MVLSIIVVSLETCKTSRFQLAINRTADPTIFIPQATIYTTLGTDAQIVATVFSSNQNDLQVEWYYEDSLINITSNPRYSMTQDMNSHVLNIMSVSEEVLGRYDAVASVGRRNQSATIQLMFPGTVNVRGEYCVIIKRNQLFESCWYSLV